MKNIAFLLIFVLVSCSAVNYKAVGTYKSHGSDSFGYGKECNQLTVFKDSTFEYVSCGEIKYPNYGTYKMIADTIYFEGSGSILSQAVNHSKCLFVGNAFYRINRSNEPAEIWTFKRKSRKPRPYRNNRK